MRIGLDATPLTVTTGGIRRYTIELARALSESFVGDQIWLISDQAFEDPGLEGVNYAGGPRRGLERRWWLWGAKREIARLGLDVFHGTDFSVPYSHSRPSVVTIHDLSPWLEPCWHRGSDRIRRRTPVLLKLGLATLILTPSEAVRKQVIERFAIKPDRVVAVPLAANPCFRPVATNPDERRYYLYVGTIEPRKNVPMLVDCWREVRKSQNVDLKLVGRHRGDGPEVRAEPGLEITGAVRDDELPALYSGAIAVVYPSLYEGFGLPVLEAMQCGAAVITSRDPAITETAGGAALQLDVNDRREWVGALTEGLGEPPWLRELREKGVKRASDFSWMRTASMTREVYEEAIRRHSGGA